MAKKQLGQNFLFDPSILRRIVDVSGLTDNDLVIEIGPGHGRLTDLLINKAERVIAIEIDSYFANQLKERYKEYGNINIVEGDALKFNYNSLPYFKVVANIPYYITTPIIFNLLKSNKNLISMTFTLQKEVAKRISAKPNTKDYGALSVAIQYYGKPEIAFIIPRGAFRPIPKVDSAVIHIEMFKQPPIQVGNEKIFFNIVKSAFHQRRKTLSNSLKSLIPNVKFFLEKIGIDSMRRGETLSLEEFALISREIIKTEIQR
ncbi:MAG TPA: ribosomal RNA small subunit methyltransferase A [Nitrospirae bacterium]|nr:ribosomal RNA small subunit methyltransferase A [Nitrospirota bacterium]